jgi:hypothetical protein
MRPIRSWATEGIEVDDAPLLGAAEEVVGMVAAIGAEFAVDTGGIGNSDCSW